MARLFWWLPLVSLFVSSLVVPRQAAAQTKPAKPPAQKAKAQPQQATAPAQPGAAKPQPASTPAQPTGAQNPPAGAPAQPGAQTQPAGAQTQPAASAQPPQINSINIFQTAATPQGQATFYLEITGQNLPTTNASVFIAPHEGITDHTTQVVSSTATLIGVKFSASKGYFPASVAVAGTGGVSNTFDVPKNANINSTLPRIDDVEVLELNRMVGTGSIKIDGANFGNDPSKISVTIVPREPSLSVFAPVTPQDSYTCPAYKPGQETTTPTVRSAKDDIVIVDFSFPCAAGYSVPFVIARVVLTVTEKNGQQTSDSQEMQPERDKNLTYRSTILSSTQARSRFGGGIAKNFYVVQLSIVNHGSTKIQVPLASIQAEVEWFAGSGEKNKYYREGPATVAPVPLAGAVSYFSTHRQATGPRAIFFNALQGLTTIGSAIQLFFGPGFAQGVGIAGGGLRQGLGQIFQDTSEQQLANLTSQSFESIETVSGNGGSIEKVIFIQRGEEKLGPATFGGTRYKFSRLIDNILGFEITGYEVPETAAKSATPQP